VPLRFRSITSIGILLPEKWFFVAEARNSHFSGILPQFVAEIRNRIVSLSLVSLFFLLPLPAARNAPWLKNAEQTLEDL
jgi:hypothetical protein